MTPEEQMRLEQLCNQIKVERNPAIFRDLTRELLELLDAKDARIHSDAKQS